MVKDNYIEAEGIVDSVIKDKVFVTVPNGTSTNTVICTLSGKIRMSGIKLLPEDRVLIEISAYDLTKGRVIYRLKQ
jgi:translation initiation factor IF-1